MLFSQSAEETVRLHLEGIAAGENMQPGDIDEFEVQHRSREFYFDCSSLLLRTEL